MVELVITAVLATLLIEDMIFPCVITTEAVGVSCKLEEVNNVDEKLAEVVEQLSEEKLTELVAVEVK